jgi:hypothetical protein
MPFSANDSVDILIRARSEGQDQIKALDSATKGYDSTVKANTSTLKALEETNKSLIKSVDLLTASISKSGTSTRQATKDFDDFTKSLQSIISNPAYSINSPFALLGRGAQQLTAALGPVGVAVTATAVGIGVLAKSAFDLVNTMGEGARELQNFALRLDLTVAQAQRLSFAAQLTGVNISTLEQSTRTLSNALDDPGGSGKKQIAILQQLGVSTRDLNGTQRELGSVVTDVLEKLSGLSNAAERAHDGQVLLGRGSKELIPLLANYKEATELADKFAASLDSNANAKLLEGKRAIAEFDIAWESLKKNLAAKIEPIIVPIIQVVTNVLQGPQVGGNLPKNLNPATIALLSHGGITAGQVQSSQSNDFFNNIAAAAGTNKAVSSFDSSKGKTIEGLNEIIAKAKTAQKELDAAIHGGEGSDAIKKDRAEYNKQGGIIADAQAQISNLEKLKRLPAEAQNAFASFITSMAEKVAGDASPIVKLTQQYDDFMKKNGAYLSAQQKEDARIAVSTAKLAEFTNEWAKLDATKKKIANETLTGLNSLLTEAETKDLEEHTKALNKATEASRKYNEVGMNAGVTSANNRSDFQTRLVDARTRPGDEIFAESQKYQIRLQAEHDILNIELRAAQMEGDKDKERLLTYKSILNDEEANIKFREEGELRIAEIRKQADQDARDTAGKVFDSLTANGGGGLGQFFQAEMKTIERQLFVNASSMVFDGSPLLGIGNVIPGQRGSDGKLSGIGKLLQGTILGNKGGTSVEDYTRRTAIATEKIASGVTVGPSGLPGLSVTTGIPGFESIPGGNLLNLFGSDVGGFTGSSSSSKSPIAKILGGGSSSTSGLSGFLGGALGLASGSSNFFDSLEGKGTNATVSHNEYGTSINSTHQTGAERAGTIVGGLGTIYAGTKGAIAGFKSGGVGGITSGIASIAGTAAALDPEPISKAVLGGVALVSSIIGDIFGNSKAKRASAIENYINNNQNLLPEAISRDVDISGAAAIYQSNGGVKAAGTTVVNHWNVSAMDADSFHAFATKNSSTFASAVNSSLQLGHPLSSTIANQFAN